MALAYFERATDRPAVRVNALADRRRIDAGASRPLRYRHALAAMFQISAAAPVVSLLGARCPTAVRSRVGAIVVDAINGPSGRPRPHVGTKAGKVGPFRADRDAAPAVAQEGGIVGVAAPLPHVDPQIIDSVVAASVRRGAGGRRLISKATARLDFPSKKVVATDVLCLSAVAPTLPAVPIGGKRRHLAKDNQAAKSAPGQIMFLRHMAMINEQVVGGYFG